MNNTVTLTPAAITHIKKMLSKHDKCYLVFGVRGGGCAGFEYTYEMIDCDDWIRCGTIYDDCIDLGDTQYFVVDSASQMHVLGSQIDYVEDFINSQIKIDNPNARSSCGCGTSISF